MTDLIKELREQISELTRQRDAAIAKLDMLERSIADLSHPNMRLLLAAWDAEKAARRALAEAGQEVMPAELLHLRGMEGDQKKNRFSHWIWRRYADAFWDDIRIDRVLPHREAKENDDERHCHPLQLDVIERACVLWSNPGEVVFTPFMGVGSEVYGAVLNGRKGVGVELKTAYYNQAVRNLAAVENHVEQELIPV